MEPCLVGGGAAVVAAAYLAAAPLEAVETMEDSSFVRAGVRFDITYHVERRSK